MKNLSIVIVSALCLVLTACGGDDKSESSSNNIVRTQSSASAGGTRSNNCGVGYDASYSKQMNGSSYGSSAQVDYYQDYQTGGSTYADDKYTLSGTAGGVHVYDHVSEDKIITCKPYVAPKPAYTPAPKPTYNAPAPKPTYNAPAPKPTYNAPAPTPTYNAPVAPTKKY